MKPSEGVKSAWPGVRKQGHEAPAPLWRLHSDRVNRGLIERWLHGRSGAVLKTDLYDECASGGLFPFLAAQFDRIHGVDVDADVAAAAGRRYPGLKSVCADVRSMPFPGETFDVVTSNSTLDHFDSEASVISALAEIHRVLRPGGLLLLTLDNPRNPLIALRNRLPVRAATALRGGFPYPAGWTTGATGLRVLLGSADFSVLELATVSHAPRALLALSHRPATSSSRRLAAALWLERLGRLPTRALTGHFVAALAVRGRR